MWLIRKDVIEAVEHARAKGLAAPAGAVDAFNRQLAECAATGEPRIFRRAGDVAEIQVHGVLTPKPDFYAYYYGGGNTTYPEIVQSLALAAADPSIRRVVLNVASPGGYVAGLFDTLAALETFPKPKETFAAQADSAAYAIAALGGKITATNPAAEFGSVGVCATYVKYDYEEVIDITSSNAPDKRPDPGTEQGQAVIRKYLDAIEELFVDAIAKGRGTTSEDVTTNYGRGAVMLANAAKKLGLIDKVAKSPGRSSALSVEDAAAPAVPAAIAPAPAAASPSADAPLAPPAPAQLQAPVAPLTSAPAVSGGAPTRTKKTMDEKQLQAEHPELYSAVFNKGKAAGEADKAKAVSDALTEEKDRVEAHLVMGETCGDMKLAVESVRGGAKMTQTLTAKYMSAGLNQRDRQARQADDAVAAAATGGAAGAPPVGKSAKEAVADAIERQSKGGVDSE